MSKMLLLALLLTTSCVSTDPIMRYSLEIITWVDYVPYDEVGYFATLEECVEAAKGIRTTQPYTAHCQSIEMTVSRSLDYFNMLPDMPKGRDLGPLMEDREI